MLTFHKVILFIVNHNHFNNQTIQNNKISPQKIIGISYSNYIYQTQLQYCKKSALIIGKVDFFYDYGPNDIDIGFMQINNDILSSKRGNGYWLWKPYFILKTLIEKLNDGDYLI